MGVQEEGMGVEEKFVFFLCGFEFIWFSRPTYIHGTDMPDCHITFKWKLYVYLLKLSQREG